mgnify:CR=1 FL=1
MTNPKPEFFTQQFIEALVKLKIPAIINCSWGGLTELTDTPDSIFFVNHIPYDWIFPKMYGVIHHGGSGTTHQSAINACVQLIIPHIMDQFFWNKVIQSKGLGPLGISIHQFSQQKLEERLLDFYQNQNYRSSSENLISLCNEKDVGIQGIKMIARGGWGNSKKDCGTWYDPHRDQESIDKIHTEFLDNFIYRKEV